MENQMIQQSSNAPAMKPQQSSSGVQIAQSRAIQEVEAAVVLAKRFPRDFNHVDLMVDRACKRIKLAKAAMYAYPRGGQVVTGPSIRLAEAIAQVYGNLSFGIKEISQSKGESVVMAYCWDYETNVRQEKTFTVKHERYTKKGTKKLTDPRDIYELVANNGARRLRACILGVIPGDIIEAAQETCEKTIKGQNSEPLVDRVKAMVKAFSERGVTQEMIEKRLGHNLDATIEQELVDLGKIYNSLKDGMSKRDQWFELAKKPDQSATEGLNAKLNDKPKENVETPKPE